jgi:folate-binding Fe-S cluster repair protein YgfZ
LKKDNHNKLITFGRHTIANWVVIEIDGKKEKIDEFLQGQLTSDIHMINNNGFQLSSICDHKGFVICDFIIHVNDNIYKVVINKELADIFIKELTPFAKFYSVTFHLLLDMSRMIKVCVIGKMKNIVLDLNFMIKTSLKPAQ